MNESGDETTNDGYSPIVGKTARWARKMTAKRMPYLNGSVIEIACDGDHFARGIHDLKRKRLLNEFMAERNEQN